MVFDNIVPTLRLIPCLEELYNKRFAFIPFMDCQPNTNYLVSQDGKHVVVGIDFCGGYTQIKEVNITSAGIRSKNAAPSFMRRNKNGFRVNASLPSAVFGAFVLGQMPRFKLQHIDGNLNNCHIENLAISDEATFSNNIKALSETYEEKFMEVVEALLKFRSITRQDAEDFTSEAFLRMCGSVTEIDMARCTGLWVFLAKERILTYYSRNKLIYETYEQIQRYGCVYQENVNESSAILNLLPDTCRQICSLLLAGYNQYEIGDKMGITQSWVSLQLKNIKRIIKRYEKV